VIYVGIDDTDTKDAPGTNKLARSLIVNLQADFQSVVAVRHQLLFDSRIPYTSKNSSASIQFQSTDADRLEELAARLRREMLDWFVEGSDPGLCVTEQVPQEVVQFGRRCQQDVVSQQEARDLAARHNIHLEGLGGTEDGVIGALAAVGLAFDGNDGRVVNIGHWPDDLAGPLDAALLLSRGVDEIRCVDTGQLVTEGPVDECLIDECLIDVGKHLRPSYRGGRIVQFVQATPSAPAPWTAVRFT